MNRPRLLRLLLALALTPTASSAGGGGETALVIADPSDRESMYVAHYFQSAHDVPAGNVLYMRPGASGFEAFRSVRARAFLGELNHRGLDGHVDYVVLAPSDSFYVPASGLIHDTCFPVTRLALASCYTLARRLDGLSAGSAVSATNHYSAAGYQPLPFDAQQAWFQGEPTESALGRQYFMGALLGWTGQNGNSLAEILGAIDNAVLANSATPTGTFYFMETTDNTRSDPRDHAFPAAVNSITNAGGAAEHLFADLPIGEHDALGILTGLANPPIDSADLTLLAGAFADHLTSYAGTFDNNSQTKMSRWIAKGATATSGTVEEPCNYSGKFPHARLHTNYFKGLSLGEAWLRSMEWEPFQNLFYGDPLARPYAQPVTVDVGDFPLAPASGTLTLTPSAATSAPGAAVARLELLVDGKLLATVAPGEAFQLDTTALADGWHDVRVLATDDSHVGNSGRFGALLEVDNLGLSATLGAAPLAGDLSTPFDLALSAVGAPLERIYVLQNGRVVASAAAPSTVAVHGLQLGAGPALELVAEAHFVGGGRARSLPLELEVDFADGTPIGVAPVAYDSYKIIASNCEAALVELPASYSSDPTSATYTIEVAPAQATILESGAGPYVILLPNESASGSDTLQFRVQTPDGTSAPASVALEYLGQGCGPPPPVITAVVPASVPAVVVGSGENVTLLGDRMTGVTEVSVNGAPLPFPPTFTVVDDDTLTFAMPLVDTLGPVTIEVAGAHGSASASIEVVAPASPVLELGDGLDPEPLFSFVPLRLVAGGAPGSATLFFASLDPAPSLLPGIWSLDLGGDHANLVLVTTQVLGPQAWAELEFFAGGIPGGANVYFQNAEYDPVSGTLPVAVSNLATGLWLF